MSTQFDRRSSPVYYTERPLLCTTRRAGQSAAAEPRRVCLTRSISYNWLKIPTEGWIPIRRRAFVATVFPRSCFCNFRNESHSFFLKFKYQVTHFCILNVTTCIWIWICFICILFSYGMPDISRNLSKGAHTRQKGVKIIILILSVF